MYNELIDLNYTLVSNQKIRLTTSLIKSGMFLSTSRKVFVDPYAQGPEWHGFPPLRELFDEGVKSGLWEADVAEEYGNKLWRSYD